MADRNPLLHHDAEPAARNQPLMCSIPEQKEPSTSSARQSRAGLRQATEAGFTGHAAWLEKQCQFVQTQDGHQRCKRSSAHVRSVLRLFSEPKAKGSDKTTDEEKEKAPKLSVPWGQEVLMADWSEVGFRLFNQPVMQDMNRVRSIMAKEDLLSASPQGIIALAKWLQRFDNHVRHVMTLKEYFLEERTLIAGVEHKVTTLYDVYDEAMAAALAKVHDERRDLSEAALRMFNELEKIMEGEVCAAKHVITQTLTQKEEYEALSTVFSELPRGVIVAHLLGWMYNHMREEDVHVFLALINSNVQDRIAGEWMRMYASYLHLLDTFSLQSQSSLSYFT